MEMLRILVEPRAVTRQYWWRQFVFDDKSIRWDVVYLDRIIGVRNSRIAQRGTVHLADLSPLVEVRHEAPERYFVVLSCSSGACIESTERSVIGLTVRIEYDDENMSPPEVKRLRKIDLPVCDRKGEVERLSRAFSHLITTAGGKKPLF
jgi:hypothetical protein